MSDFKQDTEQQAAPPCGFGIFEGEELLAAFPNEAKAREVLQACEQDGYRTDRMAMRAIFLAAAPPQDAARIAALEAELQQARAELAELKRQRSEWLAELQALREGL